MIGKTLAHYEIREHLGKGGMGDVFVAHDRKLSRDVALKVLPPELAQSPERLARFEREAKAIAALNHPNIVHVYSVEEADGVHFITMELVRGKTLAEAIPKSGFGVSRFFDLALGLTEAVVAAHRAGVIHRDLKPSNVMVSDEGRLKVLDFGLARPRGLASDSFGSELDTALKTVEGGVLGTPAYMAPEQLEGKSVDERSDLFALGIVFHEMLTGKRPFGGETYLDGAVPRSVARLVKRCLQKDPERRFQTALDVRNELEETRAELAAAPETAPVAGRWRWFAAAALVAGLAAGYVLRPAGRSSSIRFTHPRPLTSVPGVEAYPSWSPDGSRIAYSVGNPFVSSDLWVVQASGGPAVNLTADRDARDFRPAWSPDGSQIAFSSDREGFGCYVMPALGGPARKIAVTERLSIAEWSSGGTELACMSVDGVRVTELRSGTYRDVTLKGLEDLLLWDLAWSNDGQWFAYVAAVVPDSPISTLWIADAHTGEGFPLTDGTTNVWGPSFGPDGALYYVSNAAGTMDLWRQPLQRDGRPDGDAEAVTVGIGMHQRAAFSPDGKRLAFSRGGYSAQVWRVPILADREATWDDAERLTFDQAFAMFVDVSRDGRNVVFSSDRSGNLDLWVLPSEGGEPRQLTTDPTPDWGPAWSPDGTEIAFYAFRGGSRDIWVMPAGTGPARQLTHDEGSELNPRWSSDGSTILYQGVGVLTVSSSGATSPQQVVADGVTPDSSPDGQWITWATLPEWKIWVAHPDGAEPRALVESAGSVPRFGADSEHLYYADRELQNLWSVAIQTGERRRLTDFRGRVGQLGPYALAVDGNYVYFTWRQDLGDLWVMDVVR